MQSFLTDRSLISRRFTPTKDSINSITAGTCEQEPAKPSHINAQTIRCPPYSTLRLLLPSTHNPPHLLHREQTRTLPQRPNQNRHRLILKIICVSDLIQIIRKFRGGALHIDLGERRLDFRVCRTSRWLGGLFGSLRQVSG